MYLYMQQFHNYFPGLFYEVITAFTTTKVQKTKFPVESSF